MKPDINAVVFEFTTGAGDRFLFLSTVFLSICQEARESSRRSLWYGKELRATRKPTIRSKTTINLLLCTSTPHARILEPLARVVAPLDEVRRYMDDVMDNMARAKMSTLYCSYHGLQMTLAGYEEEDVGASGGRHQSDICA
jgi:hypothetical protein